jgi:peptidoglycan/LPS O-acetylase OafA/YrhL
VDGADVGSRQAQPSTAAVIDSVPSSWAQTHIPTIDGLRGVAILLVLLHHLTLYRPTAGLGYWVASVPVAGWTGVDLFFVISGFLITAILIDARGSDRYFVSFYARRTLRIFPLYYLVVFVSFAVLPALPAAEQLLVGPAPPPERWPYWLYLTNVTVADRGFSHGILDVAWSLAIEEQFYIVWAAVVWLCPPRGLGWLCAGLVVISPLLRLDAIGKGADPVVTYVLTPYRADALATGALLAWAAGRGWLQTLAPAAGWVSILGLLALVGVSLADGSTWWWGPWWQRVGYTCAALTSGALLVGALTRPRESLWTRVLSARWLRAFGKYSYALYLFHLPVLRVVRAYVFNPLEVNLLGSVWLSQLVFYVVATLPALALAWISWRIFEQPILRLKRRFPY